MRLLLLGRHLYTIAYSIYTQGKCRFLSHERFRVTRAYVLFSAVSASRACSAFLSTEQCWWWHAGAGSSCSCCSRKMLTMNRRGVARSCRTSNYAHRCPAHVISAPSPACRRWRLGRCDAVRRSDALPSRLYVPGPDPAHVGRVPIVVTCARVVCLCLTPPSSRRPPT